ncbi:MAG TPA: Mrp/NBP35 family ATP-binding protein [Candidatus Anoxymicrobiaceae bacterium]|jgi:Mrp family chromosome partitioning ATPase
MAIDDSKREGSAAAPETAAPWPEKVTKPGIKKTIAVMSGKGGVGKSALTILLAAALRRKGLEVGILDADITGPSIPMGLGMSGPVYFDQKGPTPVTSRGGIKVISMNLLLPDENKAVIWRGPIITSVVRQFYEDYDWGELDYLLVDLPPGTADVPLTVMQSIPLDGIVLVISPQELAGMIVGKARNMADSMDAPVIGLVENMSYAVCEHCGERFEPFGASHSEEAANAMGIPLLGRLPLDPEISRLADEGTLDEYTSPEIDSVVGALIERLSVV